MVETTRLLWWVPALAIVACIAVILCWTTGVAGRPDWITAIDRDRTAQIAAYDQDVCLKLGFGSDSPAHADCASRLLRVRFHDRQVNTF